MSTEDQAAALIAQAEQLTQIANLENELRAAKAHQRNNPDSPEAKERKSNVAHALQQLRREYAKNDTHVVGGDAYLDPQPED